MEQKFTYKNCYIRPLTLSDVGEDYLKWVQDKEVTRFLEIRHRTFTLEDLKEYVLSFEGDQTRYLFGVFDVETNRYVGNCTLYNVDVNAGTFDLGVMIGDKTYEGKNVGVESVLLLFKFAFEVLNMRKFFGGCYSNHIQTIFVLKRCGCDKEAVLKEKFLFEGKFVDEFIFSTTNEKWVSEIKPKFNVQ